MTFSLQWFSVFRLHHKTLLIKIKNKCVYLFFSNHCLCASKISVSLYKWLDASELSKLWIEPPNVFVCVSVKPVWLSSIRQTSRFISTIVGRYEAKTRNFIENRIIATRFIQRNSSTSNIQFIYWKSVAFWLLFSSQVPFLLPFIVWFLAEIVPFMSHCFDIVCELSIAREFFFFTHLGGSNIC